MSGFLVAGLLAFVGVASSVLLWESLAFGLAHGGPHRELRRARVRFAVGVVGLAIVIWITSGILTHAW